MSGEGRLRVLMTADAVGGVWTYSLELCRELGARGVDVALATMGPPPTSGQRAQLRHLSNVTLFTSTYQLEWMTEPWRDVASAGRWLSSLADAFGAQLVHLNGYAHAALPWRIPVLVVGHSCVVSWWRAVRGDEAAAEWDRYRYEVTEGLQAADSVVAPTRAMLRSLDGDYGPLRDARVIYNGRDRGHFQPAPKQAFVFSAGRLWDDAKNVAALDQVAPSLAWPVRVAGAIAAPGQQPRTAKHLKLLGPLSTRDLAVQLGRASIFALPARYEPFGLSALEAAYCGCALVLGDIPSLREVWKDAAVFVDPDDPRALHEALSRLIRDGEARRELAEAAFRRAQRYRPDVSASAYHALYLELLRRHRERAGRGGERCAS